MVEKFRELKKKYALLAMLKGAIAGVFFALFAVGAVMLGIKLGAMRIGWYYYLIIGIGAFAIAFVATFLLTRPTDKSLAKKLDNEYGLKEKVQTMVEFASQDSAVLSLQREDTEQTLRNLPKKKISFAKIWQYIVIAVVGIALFVTGIVVPSYYEPPVVDDDFVLNEWDEKALQQLIDDVSASALEDKVKVPSLAALELLKEELKETKSNTAMRRAVRNCAQAIDSAVILANSYRDVAVALNTQTTLKEFTTTIVKAASSYKGEIEISTLAQVKQANDQSEEKIRVCLAVFTNSLNAKIKALSQNIEIRDAVDEFLAPFNESLSPDDLQEKLDGDELYGAMASLSSALSVASEQYVFLETSYMRTIVANAFTDYISSASRVLVTQVYNNMMNELIHNTLTDVFKVSVSPEDLELPGISDGSGGSDEDPWHGGGTGDTEVIYGGNDAIYDHNSAEHVPYGMVWNDYVSKLYDKLNDEQSGLSEEMKVYIQNYIKALDGSASGSTGGEN